MEREVLIVVSLQKNDDENLMKEAGKKHSHYYLQ